MTSDRRTRLLRREDPRLFALEAKISARLPQMDVFALLDLLELLGYEPGEVWFKSHPSQTSQSGLLQSIEFLARPRPLVIITVNYGLLGANSPLPSYFMKLMESDAMQEERYFDFMDYFNHRLILNHIQSLAPHRDLSLYSSWENTKAWYLSLMGLKSVSTLHWLLQRLFPELELEVEKSCFREDLSVDTVTMGVYRLGTAAALGSRAQVPITGFDVTLYCDEEERYPGRPWVREIGERLRTNVFRVLAGSEINLRVFVVIRSQRSTAQISYGGYLGYDQLPGGDGVARRILIFQGAVVAPD